MITCSELTRRFGSKTVVDAISFDLPCGSICAFLGPNGAGKSTTLKMLSGILRPTSGMATVAGLQVGEAQDTMALKRRIGVLPEGLGLFDHLTVEEHLHMSGLIYGLSREETRVRTDRLIDLLSMKDGRHMYASECSLGTRKKAALAMALLHDPQVLLLDEPFEGIEPETAETLRALFVGLARSGVTVLFTTHILARVECFASHCMLMRNGAIAWHSRVEDLPSSLEALYFDSVEGRESEASSWLGWPRS